MFDQCRIHYTGIFLPSRDFILEKQSYVLTESPLSKHEGGTTRFTLSPFFLAEKEEMTFNTF
jgi:hypothetical protein